VRKIFAIALIPYVFWLSFFYEYHFIDGANLLFHEAGHIFFGIFGQFISVLGGTLGQFVFPIATAIHFFLRNERYEMFVCILWFGESMMYMAEYLGDAEAQILPLVGGHIHDWNWMLSKMGVLPYCETIAFIFHVLASVIVAGAVFFMFKESTNYHRDQELAM
jgi:hypothetical protein